MNIDWTSLFAGVSLTAVGGWLTSMLALRKDERAVQIDQVTKERAKWRDNIRKLAEEIAMAHAGQVGSMDSAKVAGLRARLATSINPKDKVHDAAVLAHFDRLFEEAATDRHVFERRLALLLKHDWERVKWECTPLYLKPFRCWRSQYSAWRSPTYRDIDA